MYNLFFFAQGELRYCSLPATFSFQNQFPKQFQSKD